MTEKESYEAGVEKCLEKLSHYSDGSLVALRTRDFPEGVHHAVEIEIERRRNEKDGKEEYRNFV